MSYRFVNRFRAGPGWNCKFHPGPARKLSTNLYDIRIPLPSVQWINSWWWTDELSETCRVSCQNKFVKLVHLVGFISNKCWSSIWTRQGFDCVDFCYHWRGPAAGTKVLTHDSQPLPMVPFTPVDWLNASSPNSTFNSCQFRSNFSHFVTEILHKSVVPVKTFFKSPIHTFFLHELLNVRYEEKSGFY